MKIVTSAILLLTFLAACEAENMAMESSDGMMMEETMDDSMAMESDDSMGM